MYQKRKRDKVSMDSLIVYFSVFFNVLQGSILSFVLSYLHMSNLSFQQIDNNLLKRNCKKQEL